MQSLQVVKRAIDFFKNEMHTTAREEKINSNENTKIQKIMETKSKKFTETATNENDDDDEQTDDNSDNNNDKQRAPKQRRR
jgi:hypothetical protein